MNFLFHHAVKAKSEESAFVKADIEQVNQHLKLITIMSIVCTASEKTKIKELAKNSGLSISGFVLAAITYFYENELTNKSDF